jgi:hypothetical protein
VTTSEDNVLTPGEIAYTEMAGVLIASLMDGTVVDGAVKVFLGIKRQINVLWEVAEAARAGNGVAEALAVLDEEWPAQANG